MLEQANKLISDLGNTEQEIVESLKKLNCKGKVKVPSCCVLANYLREKLSLDIYQVVVDGERVFINAKEFNTINFSSEMKNFILHFDNVMYPELVQ